MPITITSISLDTIDADGGTQLTIVGDFSGEFGKAYQMHIGLNGNYTDTPCQSGIPGQGITLYPLSATKLRCYTPKLDPGGPYAVYIRRVDNTRTQLMPAAMTVLKQMYYSSVFSLRGLAPPIFLVGPRNMDLLEPV